MEKLDLLKLSEIDKERIKKVAISKYATEEFFAAANRVYVDGHETKFCFCSYCDVFFLPIKNIWLAISEAILTVMGHENELRKQLSIHGSRKKPKFRFLSPKSINIEKKSLRPCVLVPNQFRISTLEAQMCFLMQLKVRYIKIHNFNFSKYF